MYAWITKLDHSYKLYEMGANLKLLICVGTAVQWSKSLHNCIHTFQYRAVSMYVHVLQPAKGDWFMLLSVLYIVHTEALLRIMATSLFKSLCCTLYSWNIRLDSTSAHLPLIYNPGCSAINIKLCIIIDLTGCKVMW